MKVLLLGAGASRAAGYPVTSELLTAVVEDAVGSPSTSLKAAASDWAEVTTNAKSLGLDSLLLGFPNPEIQLSYIDLWAQAIDEAPLRVLEQLGRTGVSDTATEDLWRSQAADVVGRAQRAMRHLLAEYFGYRSYLDSHDENRSKRDYLRRLFLGLKPGDAIITLNWDTTAEMTLAEEGRWSPIDGYGFRAQGVRWRATGKATSALRLEIKVLKLHAGVGWDRLRFAPDRILLSNANLLQHLPITVGSERFWCEAGPERHPGDLEVALEIPSYLKQVPKGADMNRVWSAAATSLNRADEVEVWGYGLPDSDGHLRVLLSALRRRVRHGRVRAVVHDPNTNAQARWRDLLGARAAIDGQPLQ